MDVDVELVFIRLVKVWEIKRDFFLISSHHYQWNQSVKPCDVNLHCFMWAKGLSQGKNLHTGYLEEIVYETKQMWFNSFVRCHIYFIYTEWECFKNEVLCQQSVCSLYVLQIVPPFSFFLGKYLWFTRQVCIW